MSLPLEGIKVLDLSRMWAVPGGAMYLADQGADVIKVESARGDDARWVYTLPPIKGESRAFWVVNRNKRGIAVDLRSEQGIAVLLRLAEGADVLLHNFRPGMTDQMGIGYETLKARNPGLIYLAFSPHGSKGPLRGARGYDLLIQATSGMLGRRSMPDGTPRASGLFAIDTGAALMISYAITLALFQRGSTGVGQQIESSLLGAAIALQSVELVTVKGHEEPSATTDLGTQAVYSAYRCADGTFIQLAIVNDAEWANLCRALEMEERIAAPEFGTYDARVKNTEALSRLLAERFLARPVGQWAERLQQHDVPGMVVVAPRDVFNSEQARANQMFVEQEQPPVGKAVVMNVPFRLGGATGYRFRPAPGYGEHTDEILAEAGYTPEQIESLREEQAVR